MALNYNLLLRNLERELLQKSSIDREFEAEVQSAVSPGAPPGPLRNPRFAADPELQAVAQGGLRRDVRTIPPIPHPSAAKAPRS